MRKTGGWVLVGALVLGAAGARAEGVSGKAIFEAKCAMCHGKDGSKKLDGLKGKSLDDVLKDVKEGVKGKGGTMPGYAGKLKDDEIKAVAEYTLSLKK